MLVAEKAMRNSRSSVWFVQFVYQFVCLPANGPLPCSACVLESCIWDKNPRLQRAEQKLHLLHFSAMTICVVGSAFSLGVTAAGTLQMRDVTLSTLYRKALQLWRAWQQKVAVGNGKHDSFELWEAWMERIFEWISKLAWWDNISQYCQIVRLQCSPKFAYHAPSLSLPDRWFTTLFWWASCAFGRSGRRVRCSVASIAWVSWCFRCELSSALVPHGATKCLLHDLLAASTGVSCTSWVKLMMVLPSRRHGMWRAGCLCDRNVKTTICSCAKIDRPC